MQGFAESLPPPKHKRSTDEVFSEPQRLHKVLASCGFGSRRAMEDLILAGRITVNRMPADIGQKVGPGDEVRINGEPVKIRFTEPKARVLLYHKPAGEIVSRDDPEERATVFDRLPVITDGRWIAVGRLDFNTEGLLLFTNSGELANRLMHPRYEVEREYAVRVLGRLTDEQVHALTHGIELEDGDAKCERVEDAGGDEDASNHWYKVVVKEGRNREVRRLFQALDLTVSRLIRTRYGRVAMPPPLKRGELQELEPQELNALLRFAGLKAQGGAGGEPRAPGGEGRPQGERKPQGGKRPRGGQGPRPGHPPVHAQHAGGGQPSVGPGERQPGQKKRRRGRKRGGAGGQPGQAQHAPGGGQPRPPREVNGNVAPGAHAPAGAGQPGAKRKRRRGRGGRGKGAPGGAPAQQWVGLPRDEE